MGASAYQFAPEVHFEGQRQAQISNALIEKRMFGNRYEESN